MVLLVDLIPDKRLPRRERLKFAVGLITQRMILQRSQYMKHKESFQLLKTTARQEHSVIAYKIYRTVGKQYNNHRCHNSIVSLTE